jgi:hypothetical protein
MCQLLIGLGDVTVLGVHERWLNLPLEVRIRRDPDDGTCPDCSTVGALVDVRPVRHVDLPCFGRRTILVWHKRRLGLPGRLWQLDRAGRPDRTPSSQAHGPGLPVGVSAGRDARPHGQGGRARSRRGLAHRRQRRDRLLHAAGRPSRQDRPGHSTRAGRGRVRPDWATPSPKVVDHDRGRPRLHAARCRRGPRCATGHQMARSTRSGLAGRDRVGHARSVRRLPQGV